MTTWCSHGWWETQLVMLTQGGVCNHLIWCSLVTLQNTNAPRGNKTRAERIFYTKQCCDARFEWFVCTCVCWVVLNIVKLTVIPVKLLSLSSIYMFKIHSTNIFFIISSAKLHELEFDKKKGQNFAGLTMLMKFLFILWFNQIHSERRFQTSLFN